MSLFDALRSFVGLPPRNQREEVERDSWNFGFREEDGGNADEQDVEQYREDFGFRMFSGNVLEMHKLFEQEFQEILRGFQSNWFLDGLNPNEGGGGRALAETEENPRHKYLKPSYIQPPPSGSSSHLDQEISQQVSPSRILDWFPDKGVEGTLARPSSAFSSQLIKKRILPNGGVEEERKTVKGGETVCRVSRELGGMRHILTTTSLPDGTTQTQEEFINMEPDKLPEFNNSWSKK